MDTKCSEAVELLQQLIADRESLQSEAKLAFFKTGNFNDDGDTTENDTSIKVNGA